MNDYVMFDPALRERFVAFLDGRGVASELRADAIAGVVIRIAADLASDLDDAIEAEYEALMAEQRDLTETAAGEDGRSLMAVCVDLADGRPLTVHLPARFARRLHAHFEIDEIRELVALIAHSALAPPVGPVCARR